MVFYELVENLYIPMKISYNQINEKNINQFGRFDNLKATVDINKAKAYFESIESSTIPPFKLRIKVDKHLQGFILGE